MTLHARPSTLPLLAVALLASCSSSHAPAPTYAAAIQEGQDAAYDVLRQGGDATSLGIALVNRDGLVWTESFGLADVGAKTAPTAETMFSIGSVSKVFAAVAVMQLVEQGLVDLDEPLVTYVPTFRMADPRYADITVRMLLDHASGIGGTIWRGSNTYSPDLGYADEALADLAQQRLKAAPGYMSVYCNDGFTLVEVLVRAVTGLDYADYVDRHVFQPLGMVTRRSRSRPSRRGPSPGRTWAVSRSPRSSRTSTPLAASTRPPPTWSRSSGCS